MSQHIPALLIGLVTGIIPGLILAWFTVRINRKRLSLIANIATFSLMRLPESMRDKVKVTFSDKLVPNIMLHRVTFWNNGNQVIRDHPVKFTVGTESEILYVDFSDRFEIIEEDEHYVTLNLRFLNEKESREIGLHVTGGVDDELKIDGEGPGLHFDARERVLPVIDPTVDSDELRKQLMDALFRRVNWKLVILVYVAIIAIIIGITTAIENFGQ